ncbi:MAG: phytanoyl-CoA dioxygenase family protein [Acidimicrobiales bacterium]|nr:phytanoyl-CoA dioxygenase family protein [Acidimicrobiales bacterium]
MFRDPEHERRFRRDGYLAFPGLALGVLEQARSIYATAPTGEAVPVGTYFAAEEAAADRTWRRRMAPGEQWRISTDECLPEERVRIKEAMAPLWAEIAEPLFVDYHSVINSFLTKYPGPESFLPLHQDPTVVDERVQRSVTVWLALDDISRARANGPLHVLPGSHRCGHEWRGTRTDPSYLTGLEELWGRAVAIDVSAGDVLCMDSAVLHGSPPNASDGPRGAIAGVFAPRSAQLVHAVGIEGDQVEVWGVDEDFYLHHSPGSLRKQLPTGYPVIDVTPRADPPTTAEALLAQQHFERTWRGRQHARLARAKARLLGR